MRRATPGQPNFTEWSREEKEAFAKKRMMEMREKNKKLLMRYAEVQTDRIEAESRNSAVTSASATKAVKKDNDRSHINEEVKVEYAREWDRGKPDKDHWRSPDHYESSFKNYRSSGRYDRKDGDRRDNWGNYSRDSTDYRRNRGSDSRHEMQNDYIDEDNSWGPLPNKGPSRSFKSHASEDSYERRNQDRKDTWSGYSKNESYKHDRPSDSRKYRGSYRYKSNDNQPEKSRLQVSPKRSRGLGYRTSDSHRRPQSSYSDDKYRKSDLKRSSSRKKYSHRAHSRSTSRSGSDNVNNQCSLNSNALWENDKINEDQTKQNRVERWVKSVNKTNNWGNRQYGPDQKEKNLSRISSKHDEKNYGKISHDQDNNIRKPYSKFERFERSPDRSSDEGGNKDISAQKNLCVNSNYTSPNECDKVRSISKSKSFNPKSNDSFQKAGVQTKRSPHFSSSGSMKNENFRKLRRFENKDDNPYKPRKLDLSSSSGNLEKRSDFHHSVNKNNLCNKSSKQDTSDGWNQNDDGIWGCAEQSDIKWKLSDEEPEMPVAKKQNCTEIKKSDDLDDGKKSKKIEKCPPKEEKTQHTCDDDGTWSNVDQSNVHWNPEIVSEECENLNSHSNSGHLTKDNNSLEQKDEKCELETSKSGTNDACIVECHSSSIPRLQQNSDAMSRRESNYSAEALISSFQQSLCISDAKNTNDSTDNFSEKPMVSDDGGWSTVSEEGEIHSDEESKK